MATQFEVQSYADESIHSNECTLCNKTPTVGIVSFFLKGFLGTHIIVHLCKEHWNDVDIFLAVAKALIEEANSIENGPTWKNIRKEKTALPEIDSVILCLKEAVRKDPKLKKAFTPEVAEKVS